MITPKNRKPIFITFSFAINVFANIHIKQIRTDGIIKGNAFICIFFISSSPSIFLAFLGISAVGKSF